MVSHNLSMVFTVEPSEFFVNPQTADNFFQDRSEKSEDPARAIKINEIAIAEHRSLRKKLADAGIASVAINGPEGCPDAIFPNNSFSVHERDGKAVAILYPMSPGRRQELPDDFIEFLKKISGNQFFDLRYYEEQGKFLEGTGVLNFSNDETTVYMGRSERANEEVLHKVCELLGIQADETFVFDMFDEQGRKIYHTNVISWVGKDIFAICLDSIPEGDAKRKLTQKIASEGMKLVDLTFDEVNKFSGNALEVTNSQGYSYLTISQTGYDALSPQNRITIDGYYQGRVIASDAHTIQKYGGGSVRCMEAKASLSRNLLHDILGTIKSSFGHLLLDQQSSPVPTGDYVSSNLNYE